jgi:catecholate siderophore receptor
MPTRSEFITSTQGSPCRRAATALGLAVATTAAPAFGQQTGEPVALPALRVEAADLGYKAEEASSPKLSQPLLDTPRSVTVVPQEVMEERGATTLQDVFRNVSGISLAAGEGGAPMGDNLTLRGFSARTDIFVDGMRDFGTYARDPFNLESVEVIKGPASAYAGRGATGGAINLVTKTPKRDEFTAVDLSLGTDHTKRITADVNRELEGLGEGAALRLNLMAHDSGVAGRDEVENERWGIAPSFSLGLGTPTRLTLSGLFLKQDNLPDYGHPYLDGRPVPVDRNNWYGLRDFDTDKSAAAHASLRLEHDLNGALTLRNQLSYGRTTHESIATAARNPDPVAGTVSRTFKNRDSEDTIVSNQIDLIADFQAGGMKHTLVTGVELAREESSNRGRDIVSTMPDANLSNPNPNDPFAGTISPGAHADTTAKSVAAYVFDTIALNEQWELSGGLRWDRFEVDYRSLDVPTGAATDLDRTDTMLSWNLGAVYKPRPNGSVYLAYGTSFNPSAEGLSLASRGTSLADVKPEKSRTVELGTKWDLLGRRLGLTAAIFRTDKTNARTNGDTSIGEPPFVLEGEQRVDGAELGLTGHIGERWQVLAGYTFLDSEIRKSNTPAEVGKTMPNVPRHSFTLWTTYQPMPRLELGAGAQYLSSRYANASNSNEVPDYWLFDAMAGYRLHDNVQLRLNLYNLTNEAYYGSVYGGHAVPGAGRSALLTTSFQF